MALIVVFVSRRLGAAVCCPVGLLEAGASGVATSVGVVSCYFAIASDSVSIGFFTINSVNKVSVGADNHESPSVISLVNAGLHVVEALAAVRSFFVTRDRAAGAVHDDSLLAFLDDADACGAVGAGALVAAVALNFDGVLVRAFLALGVAENAFVASGFLADAYPVFRGTARSLT